MTCDPADLPPAPGRPRTPVDDAWAHRDDLVTYARRLLGSQAELAEDVVQEAYLRLHEAAPGSRVREARPWLFRVTRNLAVDECRRVRRGDVVRSSLEVVTAASRGPLEVLQGREEARQALEGIGALPPGERRTLILDQAGLAPPAIARRMQTTTNAVHQSLFRARRRLREARSAAWGLVPLPLVRLSPGATGAPVLDRLPALAPGSGGRLAGGASLLGVVVAAVVGGGVVAERPAIPHPAHARAADLPVPRSVAPVATPAMPAASTPATSSPAAAEASAAPVRRTVARGAAPVAARRSGGAPARTPPPVPETGSAPVAAVPEREPWRDDDPGERGWRDEGEGHDDARRRGGSERHEGSRSRDDSDGSRAPDDAKDSPEPSTGSGSPGRDAPDAPDEPAGPGAPVDPAHEAAPPGATPAPAPSVPEIAPSGVDDGKGGAG